MARALAETVRRVVCDLLGTGRVPPMQGLLPTRSPGLRRLILQRLWGAVRSHDGGTMWWPSSTTCGDVRQYDGWQARS